jgi:probable HAF family extracellular repeat protein
MKTGKMLTTGVAAVCMAFLASFLASDASGASSYVVIDLTPPLYGYWECYATGISDTQQVGNTEAGPLLWSGTAANYVKLDSSLFGGLGATGVCGNQQVGHGNSGDWPHAVLWTGTASSIVDLNPSGFIASEALGTNGTQQVGYGYTPQGVWQNIRHALLWNGTAASCVDLTPPGFMGSAAYGICGTQQAGEGITPQELHHAMLWTGTAGSYVDLNPSGIGNSRAEGTNGTQQVGSGEGPATGNHRHALLWNGTAVRCIDLNPQGCVDSGACGTNGTQQVGNADPTVGGNFAVVWSGTAESYINLSQFLPSGFVESGANGINASGDIVGYAKDSSSHYHAILWEPVPDPAGLPGDANGDGTVSFADYQTLEGNFGTGTTWAQGDFNGDHAVTFADYQILEANFGKSSVPEPATLSLLILGGLALARRRR